MLDFGDFTVPKLVIHNKIINKTLKQTSRKFQTLFLRRLSQKIIS